MKEAFAPSRSLVGEREPAQSAGMKNQMIYREGHVSFTTQWLKSSGCFSTSVLEKNSKAYLTICVPLSFSTWNILCDTSFSEISLE